MKTGTCQLPTVTRNPFHNPRSAYSRPEFSYRGHSLFSFRGVDVYANGARSWDYVLNGVTIMQRAGFKAEVARALINEALDGVSPHCEAVASHITASGGKGYTYSQYIADWAAGRVA